MTFASPLWLVLALLAGLVLLLHTMRQTQHVVPSLFLWRRLPVAHTPRRSFVPPRLNLLLILQILAVLGLAAALAYPMLGGAGRTHHVLVIDRSGSMGIGDGEESRYDAALAAARAGIEGLQRSEGDLVSVIATGAGTHYLAARQAPMAALATLDGLAAGQGAADWSAVAQRLPGLLAEGEETAIAIFSDDGAAARAALAPLVDADAILVHDLPSATGRNFGVSARAVPLGEENGWESGTVRGDAVAEDPEPPVLTLRFRPLDNSPALDWATLDLSRDRTGTAEGRASWTFSTTVRFPAQGFAELVLPEDAGAFDNVYRLQLGDPLALAEVLYIGPGNDTLDLALLATGLVNLFATESVPADVSRYDLVIVENAVLNARPATNVLWLGSARLAGQEAPVRSSAEITYWDGEHPLSRAIDWGAVEVAESYVFPSDPAAHVVLAAGEVPLLSAKTLPEGRDVRLALAIGTDGWTTGSALPSLLVDLVHWLDIGLAGTVTGCEAGRECAVPAQLAGAEIRDANGTVVRRAPSPPEGAALLDSSNSFLPERSGLYTVAGARGEVERVLVNPAISEIGAPAMIAAEGDNGGAEGPAVPLWVWIALAVVIVLAIEAALALRRREGYGRTAQLTADTAAVRRKRWALGLRIAALLLIALAPLMLPFPGIGPSQRTVAVAGPGEADALASACGGLWPGAVGHVTLTAPPRVVRDASCGAANPPAPDALPSAAEGLALELAGALVPVREEGRIVLASSVGGGIDAAAAQLVARGLPVDILAPDGDAEGAWVSELVVPQVLREGDGTPVTATVGMGAAGSAEIAFGVGEREISRGTFALAAGANRIDARVPDLEEGEAVFWAQISAPGDAVPDNDRLEVLRTVLPRPRIGIITPEEEWGLYMADALAVQGLEAEVIGPRRAPFWMYGWLENYDGVMLMNVPAIDLDTRQQELLDEFVRVHGRGVLILGGENTFGPGGYFQTPLETLSPLSSRVPQEAPVVALGFVLDRSGSMQATVDGVTRLDIAKQATISAVELLNPESQVTVVAFDEAANVLVPLQERKNDAEIVAALNRLDPGGGTAIAPGLAAALDQMEAADAPIRHIVVMSDGLTQPADFEALMRRAAEMDVTVSTVAIGDGADVGRLADLARAGGGSSHVTRDFRALPGILSQEAMMLGGESFETGTFPVFWVDREAEFLEGLPDQLPPLSGYVLTSTKDGATLHLATRDADGELVPILASWRYGNGRVMALATHAVGPGSLAWQELPQFPQLYGQAMRHFLADAPAPGLTVEASRAGDALLIEADALDRDGKPVAGLTPTAELLDQTGATIAQIALQPDAPGVYLGRTGALAPGRYTVAVDAGEEPVNRTVLRGETAVIVSYSAALDPLRAAPERLAALAAGTGGSVLDGFPDTGAGLRAVLEPAWRPWLVLGLALFLLDLALRYAPGLFVRRRRPVPAQPGPEEEFVLPRAA